MGASSLEISKELNVVEVMFLSSICQFWLITQSLNLLIVKFPPALFQNLNGVKCQVVFDQSLYSCRFSLKACFLTLIKKCRFHLKCFIRYISYASNKTADYSLI